MLIKEKANLTLCMGFCIIFNPVIKRIIMLAIKRKSDTFIASLKGQKRLNVLNAPLVEEQLNEVLLNGNKVILDLQDILFIDTEGFAVLDQAFGKTVNRKGSFKLANVSPEVKELINLMQLSDKFTMVDDIEQEICTVEA